MSFIALKRGAAISISTDRLLMDADEVIACERAAELLSAVEAVHARAEAEAEALKRDAVAQGLAEGRAEALRSTAPELLARCREATDAALNSHAATQEAVVTLALHVVRRLAGDWGAADTVTALARHAWQSLSPDQRALLRVHPSVHAAVQEALRLDPVGPHAAPLEVRADASLEPFDCIFDTPAGQLIASLPDQLARIETGLMRAARRSGSSAGERQAA